MNIKTRKVDVLIKDTDGKVLVDKPVFEVPEQFSDQAAQIIAKLYAAPHENSFLEIVDRVVDRITEWGKKDGYFNGHTGHNEDEPLPETFSNRLKDILLNQRACFNSPVLFNVGLDTHSQMCSACYILKVEDNMEDILQHTVREGKIFKWGSGAGVNISKLRGSTENLSTGGKSSGPLSFMRTWDKSAAQVRSGGTLRRSAKLVCMDVDHPDIEAFIECKQKEEEKAKALVASGLSYTEAYSTVDYQNANNSIVITDKFMKAVEEDANWNLINRTDGRVAKTIKAKDLFRKIAKTAHSTGDPGLLFYDKINADNPVPSLGNIESTNPCGEYTNIPNSSCNLASMNLVAYQYDNIFKWDKFRDDIQTMITAMDIICGNADYPLEEIAKTTKAIRPLGLGFSNLGAAIMNFGWPYDSEKARNFASDISLTTMEAAVKQSIKLSKKLGPFDAFEDNKDRVIEVYGKKLTNLEDKTYTLLQIETHGIRNSQLTLLAPTGSISFVMDCDSFGIEPLFAIKSTKRMSDGSTMEIVPKCVKQVISKRIDGHLDTDKDPVFATANDISPEGHLKMMAAVQPHLSGAISKTVNLSSNSTPDDVMQTYIDAWKMGLKGVAIYVDGCKGNQPMTKKEDKQKDRIKEPKQESNTPVPGLVEGRIRLPDTRVSYNHKFNIAGHEGYVTVGVYPNGAPGEVFIRMNKQGSTLSGIMDSFAVSISLALQYGVPLQKFVDKFRSMKFEPAGITTNEDVRICDSIVDYIFRWIEHNFITKQISPLSYLEDYEDDSSDSDYEEEKIFEESIVEKQEMPKGETTGEFCSVCGGNIIKAGVCNYCTSCGISSGCS